MAFDRRDSGGTKRALSSPNVAQLYFSAVMSETPFATAGSFAAASFLTVAEVARRLRVSNMTVYRIVQAGELPAVRVGRGYRIREDDLLRYLDARYMDAG